MNRRSFFKMVTGVVAGICGLGVTKRDMQATEIKEYMRPKCKPLSEADVIKAYNDMSFDGYGTPDEMYGRSPVSAALDDIRMQNKILESQRNMWRIANIKV